MQAQTDMRVVSAGLLRQQILAVFARWGMPETAAQIAARIMVETDLSGVDSHGIGMLPYYQQLQSEGRLDPLAQPVTLRDEGPTALLDARHGIGHLAAFRATELAMDKARAQGVGMVGVTNSNHYGAAGWYARLAAEAGLVAFSFTNSPTPFLVPVFGQDRALGTNPIAFAAPTRDPARPALLDMATTAVAYGKVTIARRAGAPLPDGWSPKPDGTPEHDAVTAHEARRLTPLGGDRKRGGHKGYGLALMVEILCASLTGAKVSEARTGHFFIAIDPARFLGAEAFQEELEELLARMRGNTPIDPAQPVLVPGDPEHAALLQRGRDGIPLLPNLVEEIRQVCAASGAPFLLDAP